MAHEYDPTALDEADEVAGRYCQTADHDRDRLDDELDALDRLLDKAPRLPCGFGLLGAGWKPY